MKEAKNYKKLKNKNVQCQLCKRYCIIPPNQTGVCKVRKNINGILYSLIYEKAIAQNIDPIEKKPFYNFLPGSKVFSFATVGCNFKCLHCQNWDISQPQEIIGKKLTTSEILNFSLKNKVEGIAYTYTEPTIFFEYAYDTAKKTYKKNLFNVFVTNGYMSNETIKKMNFIDASRIDLKFFNSESYNRISGGIKLTNVLDTIQQINKIQHIELITLLIPSVNDSEEEITALSKWVKKTNKNIPLHFTAYYPAHKMFHPPTPLSTLQKARKIALEEGLNYVYIGNIQGDEGENTYCPNCGECVIKRYGTELLKKSYQILDNGYASCLKCGADLNIITNLERYRRGKKDGKRSGSLLL
ncbi:AmmeMemoRadiSam system radical SAM enzyme [Candidatus Micrarchaeota archaeon]|nr:AmmeMemoRadiSam system radical SAM enzyme [Candidatus Micrarchaeota archaeon]